MERDYKAAYRAIVFVSAMFALCAGWFAFRFICDDAYFFFRYASNSRLGYGYVWNPPPFRAVEGYSSFLWLVIIDWFWRLSGVEPPLFVNWISLLCSCGTLALIAHMVLKMPLTPAFERYRTGFLAVVLAGTVSNRTFLAWSSSGLETALFNLLVLLWVYFCSPAGFRTNCRVVLFYAVTFLLVLARPEGLLFSAFSLLFAAGIWNHAASRRKAIWGSIIALVTGSAIYYTWKFCRYGDFLPNTYYAKYSVPWPGMGAQYLFSFLLEYFLWPWLAVMALVVLRFALRKHVRENFGELIVNPAARTRAIACGALFVYFLFYTFIIGGDHFEYRIYRFFVPLIWISMVWALDKVCRDAAQAILILALSLLLSLPLPWIHWYYTRALTTRSETWHLRYSIARQLPAAFKWYGELFDSAQDDLIRHSVCIRHQEHKIFVLYRFASIPFTREQGRLIPYRIDDIPVFVDYTPSITAWLLPQVAIIDAFGLNDYYIARYRRAMRTNARMGHDDKIPPGYRESFRPNIELADGPHAVPRANPLTVAEVREIQGRFDKLIAEQSR